MSNLMTPDEARKHMKIQLIERDKTQTQLAHELGVGRGYVSAVMRGVKPPSRELLEWFGMERQTFFRVKP